MAKSKTAQFDDGMSQYERIRLAAREAGPDGDPETFKRALNATAKAPVARARKAARKRKR